MLEGPASMDRGGSDEQFCIGQGRVQSSRERLMIHAFQYLGLGRMRIVRLGQASEEHEQKKRRAKNTACVCSTQAAQCSGTAGNQLGYTWAHWVPGRCHLHDRPHFRHLNLFPRSQESQQSQGGGTVCCTVLVITVDFSHFERLPKKTPSTSIILYYPCKWHPSLQPQP